MSDPGATAPAKNPILIRHMLGLSGPALTAGAIGVGATRSAAEIEDYVKSVAPK